ncbi:50S ribosomal protein L21 [Candidatus Azambacteria bacterium]|nr:50S ribosomal protein L21 [Candidatus Azambacteria bacterium]
MSKLAIIKTGGKQYKVTEGQTIKIEKLEGKPSSEVIFSEVFLVAEGDNVQVGTPAVVGAQVKGELIDTKKGKKVIVFRYKPKKRERKKKGHRQTHTSVKITEIKG